MSIIGLRYMQIKILGWYFIYFFCDHFLWTCCQAVNDGQNLFALSVCMLKLT